MRTKKLLLPALLLVVCLLSTFQTQAQVTIGNGVRPNPNALLDLKENVSDSTSTKGLVLPRVQLEAINITNPLQDHVAGMFVYNTRPFGTGATAVTEGIYYNDGSQWVNVASSMAGTAFPQQFYMPSIVLPTEATALSWGTYDSGTQVFTIDLYTDVYAKQFGMADTATSYKSEGAGTLAVKAAGELEYFVIYYDKDVFAIQSLDANGVLKYKADPTKVTEKTFMNIVFKVK